MTSYKVDIDFRDDDAERKLDEIDRKLGKVSKRHKISLEFPDLDQTKRSLQEVSKYAGLAATAFKQLTPVGQELAKVEDNVKVVGNSLVNVSRILSGMSNYLSPVRGLSDGFATVAGSVDNAINSTARLGFAIFGVTQSVNVLKAAFGQMFDDTVGREVRLRETLLQTATSIAGTNRVLLGGLEIQDPTQKLQALEGSIAASVERIRMRSLEIAGTTSEAVISTFNVVAAQIGSFGGTLKQAEDLAVKFSGALGTLGMSNPMYARQEIGSIMMGYVDQNSVLAKTIGITNADIAKAKQTGELVDYLSKKLEVFEAGQKKASKGFAGITSNIQELQQELKRSFGAQLLDPILARIGAFYDTISGKGTMKQLVQTSQAFGQLIGSTANTAVGAVSNAPVFKGIDSESVTKAAAEIEAVFARISDYLQKLFQRLGPTIERIVDASVKSVSVLGKAFAEMGATLARVRLDQLTVRLQALTALTPSIVAAANAYAQYLNTLQQIVNTPLGRYVNEVREMNKVLKDFGVTGLVNNVIAINELKTQLPILASQIKGIGAAVGNAAQTAMTFLGNLYTEIVTRALAASSAIAGAFTKGFAQLSVLLSKLTADTARFFSTLSITATLLGGEWTALSQPLARISAELSKLSTRLQKAGADATAFGVQAKAAMDGATASAQRAGQAAGTLGITLRDGAARGAAAASSAVLGFAGSILRTAASMAAWTIGLALVFDGLRRLGEWWDNFSQNQKYKQALDQLNNGLLAQVQAARAAGKELDAVTAARQRMVQTDLDTKLQKETAELIKLEDELKRRAKNIAALRDSIRQNNVRPDEDGALTNEQVALKRDPEFARQIAERKRLIKEAEDALNKLLGKTPKGTDPELRQQENRQAIQNLADFEKQTRRSIEDEVYNYRRQVQDKELQLWRQAGDLRVQQIDQANRTLIEGVDSEARASLEALNNWILTKERGELDLEAKKREAQMAATELERSIGRFRLNLEQQIADIRKRVGQYEIGVLDKRLQAEQLIANIRNGAVTWEAQESRSSSSGQFKVGSTGRSTGPHLDIRGENAESVLQEAFTIVKAWQKSNVEHIALSNIGLKDVKNISDDNQLKQLLRQEMNAHMRRSRMPAIDIAVPEGTPLPVAHSAVKWGGKAEGYMAQSNATGNLFLHGLKPDPRSLTGGSNANIEGYLKRLSYLETRLQNIPNAEGSGAMGYFQTKSAFHKEAVSASGGRNSRSGNYDEASTAVEGWIKRHRPEAYEHIKAGRFDAADAILREGTWPSLPGGSQAQPEAVQQEARKYLSGAAQAGKSAAKPNVTLQLDTAELDAALGRMKTLNDQMIELQKQSNDFTDTENFNRFVQSLQTTKPELEGVTKELGNQKIELQALTKATEGGIYDPKLLEVNVKYQQSLQALERLRDNQIKVIQKATFSGEADRAKALKAVNDNYTVSVTQLNQIRDTNREILSIEKQREQLSQLNQERLENQRNFELQKVQLKNQAQGALIDSDNPLAVRRAEAESTIEELRLRYTDGGKSSMSSAVKAAFEAEAAAERSRAVERARLDSSISSNRKLRELENSILQLNIDQMRNELSTRTEAAKDAIDPRNYLARRRLDAEREVQDRYIDMSKGGVETLTDEQRGKLQTFAEETLKAADTMATLDKEMENFTAKLTLARESAQTVVSGYKDIVSTAIAGGDTKEALSNMTQNMGKFFTGKILDYAFRPIEKQLEATFSNLFGANEPQEKNTSALQELTDVIRSWKPGESLKTTAPPENGGGVASVDQSAAGIVQSAEKLGTGIKNTAAATANATTQTLGNLQKYTSGLAAVGGFAMGIAGGFQNIKQGGTYNVLSGLSSIFGSIGGAIGMFTPKGLFGGARALGGPVSPGIPYLVGENGPELKVFDTGGQILSNANTKNLFQRTRGTIEAEARTEASAIAPSSIRLDPIDVRSESHVINQVEYVTAEQHRRGMIETAHQAQRLTHHKLVHSVRTRADMGL